jgi:hypothetical protein
MGKTMPLQYDGVQFIYVSSEQTKAKHMELKSIKAKPLNQTMKLHAVGATDDSSKLMTRNTNSSIYMKGHKRLHDLRQERK